jgi:hypothetical protein
MANRTLTKNERDLTRRYLVWCYKTAKEELDKIDRYFTQLTVDKYILMQLKEVREYKKVNEHDHFRRVEEFRVYMEKKRINALKKKFLDGKKGKVTPEYQYLFNRFVAIQKAVTVFLGKKELAVICSLYEKEMTQRILQTREH